MKITRVLVYQIDLPLTHPYWLSGGRLKFETLDATIVQVETDAGLIGWGEGTPWGHTYLPAHGPGIRAGLSILAPHLIGVDPRSPEAVMQIMDLQLPGHPYVKSAIDVACWDILGQFANMPIWQLLGGDAPNEVLINSSISTGTPEDMLALILAAADKGYTVHSAKVGGTDVGLDIERIDMISASLPKGHKVTFDVNRAWQPAVAIEVLNSVKARDWVEQPCQTLDQCAHVAARVSNPIMLDECMSDFNDHLEAWKSSACEGVKVKPNRLGGLTKARQVRDFGVAVGWQMHLEDVGGSALADTAALHLAASTPAPNRLASWLSHDHLSVDPVSGQGVRNLGGHVVPPSLPGLGVTPDPDMLGAPVAVYS